MRRTLARMIMAAAILAVLLSTAACGVRKGRPDRGAQASASAVDPGPYRQEIAKWREQRRARLTSDDGWLTLIGLFWLREGANRIGSDPASDIVLPKAPKVFGTIDLHRSALTFDGADGKRMQLCSDADGASEPSMLTTGTMRMYAIKRGDRYGLRVKDSQSEARRHFRGIDYFPIDPKWRVVATFEPYDPPRKIKIVNMVGVESEETSPGALSFSLEGKTFRIDPIIETGEKDLFIILRDGTSGRESYGAARFLYATPPGSDRKVVLDLNKLYNPPCAFTQYATCPLPPPQNRLSIRITAGEKKYGEH
jgi:uncharacterized protein (DUF1684 family)